MMLVQPETFAEEAPGATALHRAADFFTGDHAQPGLGAGGQLVPIGNEATLSEALPHLTHARKFTALRQPRRPAEAQTFGVRRSGTGV